VKNEQLTSSSYPLTPCPFRERISGTKSRNSAPRNSANVASITQELQRREPA